MSNLRESWSYAFPGDQYVDVLGLDNYADVGAEWNKKSPEEKRADFIVSLKMVSALAMEKNKVAAMTETGNNAVTDPAWFTKIILNPIKENPDIRIAYLLVWRNFSVKHHYVPYAGHPALADFKKFHDDESTLFESDLRNIYKQ